MIFHYHFNRRSSLAIAWFVTISILFSTFPSDTRATALSTASSSSSNDIINVYDNVLPKQSCDVLHAAASKSGLGHKVFTRPLLGFNNDNDNDNDDNDSSKSMSVIERALDSILTELGDVVDETNTNPTQYVEYWTRQEWRHIEAHADVDENLAKDQDRGVFSNNGGSQSQSQSEDQQNYSYRYPKNGHVLYLKIGSEVRGPTCVFPNLKSGGELQNSVELVTVPAVDGRLLRFEGSSLHAVPRPADLWFLSFVRGASEYSPEETWGRSVILFNTWTEQPPKDVPICEVSDDRDRDHDHGDMEEDSQMNEGVVNKRDAWDEVFQLNPSHTSTRTRTCTSEGEPQVCDDADDATDQDAAAMSKVKIWLLGNERRRDYQMRTVQMKAQSSVKDAFLESKRVSRVLLEQ